MKVQMAMSSIRVDSAFSSLYGIRFLGSFLLQVRREKSTITQIICLFVCPFYTKSFKNTFTNFGGSFLLQNEKSEYKHTSTNARQMNGLYVRQILLSSIEFLSVLQPKTIT